MATLVVTPVPTAAVAAAAAGCLETLGGNRRRLSPRATAASSSQEVKKGEIQKIEEKLRSGLARSWTHSAQNLNAQLGGRRCLHFSCVLISQLTHLLGW